MNAEGGRNFLNARVVERRLPRGALLAAFLALIAMVASQFTLAQGDDSNPEPESAEPGRDVAKPPEDPDQPRWHFRARNGAKLTADEARRLYAGLKDDLKARYGLSRHPGAIEYQSWRRYNLSPYPSAAHGSRFLNNYANDTARAYGRFEEAGRLPVGSVLAKDSFTLDKDGAVQPGPLFLMEKMTEGFNLVSGDWRYTMIMPDGSVFGTTKGNGDERVKFCVSCHLAAERHDHLFFVPKEFRPR